MYYNNYFNYEINLFEKYKTEKLIYYILQLI